MSRRLQVLLDETDFDDLRERARRQGLTVADVVRRALRDARAAEAGGDMAAKLAAVRAAARHSFPAVDVDDMLAEIERGRGALAGE